MMRPCGGENGADAGQLREQLNAIRPSLAQSGLMTSESAEKGYGEKQLRPLEDALSVRSDEIRRLLRRLEGLGSRIDAAEADSEVSEE